MGRYTWSSVWGYRSACYDALQRAEKKHGRPVYIAEICKEWNSILPYIHCLLVLGGLLELYKADEVLADYECNLWSLNPFH